VWLTAWKRIPPPRVITPNFVTVGQAVYTDGVPKNLGHWGPLPWMGASLTP